MKRKQYSHNQGGISLAGLLCLFGTFLVSGSLFWLAAPDRSTVSKDKAEFISAPISQGAEQEVGYCPISQIELGQRTLGTNPLREEVPENLRDPDPTFWREVHLQVADESQEEVTIQLLRPLGWIYAQNAWLGNKIPLELTELHVNGEAVVTYVGSCPPIRPGPGNVVTGKYIHQSADNLIDLSIEGENRPTGVTTNHPYWSVDRQCFLQAGDLKRGEHVETRYGPRQVVSLTPRGNQPVYNLEVHGEHVYRVGTLGTLVHNKGISRTRNRFIDDREINAAGQWSPGSPDIKVNKYAIDRLAKSSSRKFELYKTVYHEAFHRKVYKLDVLIGKLLGLKADIYSVSRFNRKYNGGKGRWFDLEERAANWWGELRAKLRINYGIK
ncbi:MAG: HINT domain-containing protein [bacterium]|nr:HINT domain-containing protein [bacterium]